MLEVLYDINTLEVRAWNADPLAQGNFLPGPDQDVVVLPIDPPTAPSDWFVVDLVAQDMLPNPDYDPLTPDERRALEILATSPDAITQPEMWELIRIFGRRLGYYF